MIWPHVTRAHPCPICGKPDWCQVGDRAVKCMRVESERACTSGGWYHFFGDDKPRPMPIRQERKQPGVAIDAEKLMSVWRAATTREQIAKLSGQLGVTTEALDDIGAAWSPSNRAWAFTMRLPDGKGVGIRLRAENGRKWAVTGSRQGLFIPREPAVPARVAYLPEGPTDLAAVLSMGLWGIGRATCSTGGKEIAEALRSSGIFRAVIIADNDEMKTLGNRDGRPGIEGALKLKKELGLASVIWIPPSPFKDVREFYRAGGTARLIENDIKNKVWSKQ